MFIFRETKLRQGSRATRNGYYVVKKRPKSFWSSSKKKTEKDSWERNKKKKKKKKKKKINPGKRATREKEKVTGGPCSPFRPNSNFSNFTSRQYSSIAIDPRAKRVTPDRLLRDNLVRTHYQREKEEEEEEEEEKEEEEEEGEKKMLKKKNAPLRIARRIEQHWLSRV